MQNSHIATPTDSLQRGQTGIQHTQQQVLIPLAGVRILLWAMAYGKASIPPENVRIATRHPPCFQGWTLKEAHVKGDEHLVLRAI
jgi:hypothetical protein